MVIQHNMRAMNSNRQLNITASQQAKSTEKLSSGYRINRAADDAAGLSISEKMRAQVRGLTQASRNAQDGISLVQTAEGALGEVTDMIQRMKELAVQGANEINTTSQVKDINKEISALQTEIGRIATDTKFNGKQLFKAEGAETEVSTNFHVGDETGSVQIAATTKDIAKGLATLSYQPVLEDGTNDTPVDESGDLLAAVDETNLGMRNFIDLAGSAIETVAGWRSDLGAVQNRLESTIRNLDNVVENTTAAESRIRDTDMSTEMVKYSNNNILSQAGQAMLAQSNQANQGVLSLLQ